MKATALQITYKLDEESATALVRMLGKLVAMEGTIMGMQAKITELSQKMSELGTSVEAAIALMAALKAGGGDETAVQGMIDQLGAVNTALNTAIAANTPPTA